jgi:hypothetical protein
LLPVAYNWKTGVICKWEFGDISACEPGTSLQEQLKTFQNSKEVIRKSFALCSKSDGRKLKPEDKLSKALRHFTAFPLYSLQ